MEMFSNVLFTQKLLPKVEKLFEKSKDMWSEAIPHIKTTNDLWVIIGKENVAQIIEEFDKEVGAFEGNPNLKEWENHEDFYLFSLGLFLNMLLFIYMIPLCKKSEIELRIEKLFRKSVYDAICLFDMTDIFDECANFYNVYPGYTRNVCKHVVRSMESYIAPTIGVTQLKANGTTNRNTLPYLIHANDFVITEDTLNDYINNIFIDAKEAIINRSLFPENNAWVTSITELDCVIQLLGKQKQILQFPTYSLITTAVRKCIDRNHIKL